MDKTHNLEREISERIFSLLKEQKVTQKEFAEMLGLSPQAISDWKKGVNTSFTKYLGIIAEALQTTPNWLFSGTGEKSFSKEQRKAFEMQEQAELAAVTTELDKYENQLKLEIGDIVQQKAEEFGVPVSELLGKNIPLASYLGLTTSELLGEVATPTPGKSPPGLSEDELQVALAYRAADERARSLVDLVLEPWKKPDKLNEAM